MGSGWVRNECVMCRRQLKFIYVYAYQSYLLVWMIFDCF